MLKEIQTQGVSKIPKIDTLIDQFTLVYSTEIYDNWTTACEEFRQLLVNTFLYDFEFTEITKTQNYNTVYNYLYGPNKDLVQISYDTNRSSNGICLFTSGEGLKSISKSIGLLDFQVIQTACRVGDNNGFSARISRVDLTVDLFNYRFDMDKFIKNLGSGKIVSKTVKNRPSTSKNNSRGSSKATNGISTHGWLGSTGSGNSFLRYYDKKIEQEAKNGSRLAFANSLDYWTRFEYEIRGDKAHTILGDILNIKTYSELNDFVIQYITDQYRFYRGSRLTRLTRYMLSFLRRRSERSSVVDARNENTDFERLYSYVATGNNGNKKLAKQLAEMYGQDKAITMLMDIVKGYLEDE